MGTEKGSFTVPIAPTVGLRPPPIQCDWEVEFDGDPEYEKVLLAYYRKHYETGLKKVIESQARNFATPLAAMQKDIDGMRRAQQLIKSQTTQPTREAAIKAFRNTYKTDFKTQLNAIDDYLGKAVENVEKQQLVGFGKTFEATALVDARKSIRRDVKSKRFRHVASVSVRGAVGLTVAAAAIGATVATFGAAAPAFGAIAIAGASLGGAVKLAKFGKSIIAIRDLERRSTQLLLKDIGGVTGQINGIETQLSGIGKHVNDVSVYFSRRHEQTVALGEQLAETKKNLDAARARLETSRSSMPQLYAALKPRFAKANANFESAQAAWKKSHEREEQLKAGLAAAQMVIVELKKIPFQNAGTLLERLKGLDLKDADTYIVLGEALAITAETVGRLGEVLRVGDIIPGGE